MTRMQMTALAGLVVLLTGCAKEPTANFSYTAEEMSPPFDISFENSSKQADTFRWDFGDGSSSNERNPTHTYTRGGAFTVSLRASGRGGEHTVSKEIVTTYFVENLSSYTLYAVESYYEENGTKLFYYDHGDMLSQVTSIEVISNGSPLRLQFELESGMIGTVIEPYRLETGQQNYLAIYDETQCTWEDPSKSSVKTGHLGDQR